MPNHAVQQGECLSSIAESYGFTVDRLWKLSENAGLKQQRKNPNVLFPGDVVFIPEKDDRVESCGTGKRHQFRLDRRPPVELRLRLLSAGEPIVDEPYRLEIEGTAVEGTTDGQGRILQTIPHSATEALLRVDNKHLMLRLALGSLDPLTEITGVQARLNNLGFRCGDVDGQLSPKTRVALESFQETYNLTANGEPSVETQDKLKELHGC